MCSASYSLKSEINLQIIAVFRVCMSKLTIINKSRKENYLQIVAVFLYFKVKYFKYQPSLCREM